MVTSHGMRFGLLASFLLGVVGACSSEVSVGSSGASSSSGAAGGGTTASSGGAGGSCPQASDACQACMTGIDACAPLELCLADAVCAQQWEQFKACEVAGKDFSKCINLLTAGPDLVLKGAAFCDKPCAGLNATCKAKSSAGACAQCCAASHPQGFSAYSLTAYGCACTACDAMCAAATCQANQPPGDACVACVQTSLFHDCEGDPAFQANCAGATDSDCAELVDCILNCG